MVIDIQGGDIITMAAMEDTLPHLLSMYSIVGEFNLREAIRTGQRYVYEVDNK